MATPLKQRRRKRSAKFLTGFRAESAILHNVTPRSFARQATTEKLVNTLNLSFASSSQQLSVIFGKSNWRTVQNHFGIPITLCETSAS